jgi:hypothetical protein
MNCALGERSSQNDLPRDPTRICLRHTAADFQSWGFDCTTRQALFDEPEASALVRHLILPVAIVNIEPERTRFGRWL